MRKTLLLFSLIGLLLVALGASAEDDHGDSPLTATPVPTDGSLVQGCIEEPGDVDYFLFSAIGGRRYIIQTSHLTPEMDTIIYLFDTDGQTILAVDDNSGGEAASKIEWTSPVPGAYFVMVRHARATSGTGCYALSISAAQADDHGDDPLSATPISTDGRPLSGYIEAPGDVDYFLFVAEAGWNYIIRTGQLTAEMDTVITLYDIDGRTVLAQDDDSGDGKASKIGWAASASGTYFVEVRHADPEGTGGYELAVERVGYGDDHGNDPQSATPISADGTPVAGRIEVPGDVDYFSFSATAEGEYTIATSSLSMEMDTVLTLYGTDGRTILAQDDNSGGGAASKIEWTAPQSGTYFVQVRHSRPSGTGSYQLTISAVLQLEAVGSFNPSGYALDVWVEGEYAYVVLGYFGLLVLDVSDPSSPQEVGSHSTRGYAWSIQVQGKYAYIADRGGGLVIMDVSDPAEPVEKGSLDTDGSAWDIFTTGRYAYIADYRGGLVIADISTTRSEILGSWTTAGDAQGVFVSGDYAYVAIGEEGLEIVDISDPREPVGVGTVNLPGESHAVWVQGDYAYVASGYRGVQVVDISDPTSPTQVGAYDTGGEAYGLFLRGSYLYVADYTAGLLVLSLAEPAAPRPVAELDTPGSAVNVFVAGSFAYVADKEEGLQIVRLMP